MIDHGGGGGGALSKCSKTNYYKNLLGTYLYKPVGRYQFYNGIYQGFSYECVQSN